LDQTRPADSFTRANSNPLSQHKAISPELHSRPEPKQETSPEDFRLNGGLGPWAVRNAQVFPKLRLLSATPYLRFNLLKISLKSSTAPADSQRAIPNACLLVRWRQACPFFKDLIAWGIR
jgi:hypothetical protein